MVENGETEQDETGESTTPTGPGGAASGETEPEDLWERLRRGQLGGSDTEPRPTGETTGTHIVIGEADTPAIRQLKTWVARRTRTQVVALVLVSLLAFGPLFAVVLILRADDGPVSELISVDGNDPDVTYVTATFTSLSTTLGEVRTRFAISPARDLVDEGGRLLEPLSIVTNGTITELRAGDVVRPFEVTLAMSQGSVTRYPFDRYQGPLNLYVASENEDERQFLPFVPQVHSVVGDFTVRAEPRDPEMAGEQQLAVVDWSAVRPPTTTVYAIWLMILMWALSVTGLLIVWSVIMWMVELPMWVFGYFVGVLFALPPLRDSLPGRPPPGTLFDFLSFYWSVTIIGVSLILSLSTWLTRTRAERKLRELDTGTHETVD